MASSTIEEFKVHWKQNIEEIRQRLLGQMTDSVLPDGCVEGETLIISNFWTTCHIVVLEGGKTFDIRLTLGREYDPSETYQVVRPAF